MSEKTGIIYKATNKINGKAYIGQTTKILSERIIGHYHRAKIANNHFHNAIKKYQKDDWQWEVLYENIPKSQINNMERWCITNHDTYNIGYNSTFGGETNPMDYSEIRKKLSQSLKKLPPRTEEIRKRMSEAQSGEKHRLFGKHHSEETRKRISMANKNHKVSDETKNKISKANNGKKRSERVKKQMSDTRKGEGNGHYGKPHSEKTKKILSEMFSKTYKIFNPDGGITIIKNLKQFCENNNLNVNSMRRVSRGEQEHHKGFRCEYYNDKD